MPDKKDLSIGGIFKAAFSAATWRSKSDAKGAEVESLAGTVDTAGNDNNNNGNGSSSKNENNNKSSPGEAGSESKKSGTEAGGKSAGGAVEVEGEEVGDWRSGGPDVDPKTLVPAEVLEEAKKRHEGDLPDTVFISYCHKDSAFVKRLVAVLQASGIDPWTDYDDLRPAVEWWKEIELSIDSADTIINIISPAYLDSFNCNREVEYAEAKGKVVIPVVITPVNIDLVPKPLAARNFIFWNDTDDYHEKYTLLLEAIESNFDDKRFHTVLLSRALQWESRERPASLLLSGSELVDAESWLERVSASSHRVSPSPLHLHYIRESRDEVARALEAHAAATRRRMVLFFGLLMLSCVLLAGSIALVIFAFYEMHRADEATREAHEVAQIWIREQLVTMLRTSGLVGSLAAHVLPSTLPLALYGLEALRAVTNGTNYATNAERAAARAAAAGNDAWAHEAVAEPFLAAGSDTHGPIAARMVDAASASAMAAGLPGVGFIGAGVVTPLGPDGAMWIAHVSPGGELSVAGPLPNAASEGNEDPYFLAGSASSPVRVERVDVGAGVSVLSCAVSQLGAVGQSHHAGDTLACVAVTGLGASISSEPTGGMPLRTVTVDVRRLLALGGAPPAGQTIVSYLDVGVVAAAGKGAAWGWIGSENPPRQDVPSMKSAVLNAAATPVLIAPTVTVVPDAAASAGGNTAAAGPYLAAVASVDDDHGRRAVTIWDASRAHGDAAGTHYWYAPASADIASFAFSGTVLLVAVVPQGLTLASAEDHTVIYTINLRDGLAASLGTPAAAEARTYVLTPSTPAEQATFDAAGRVHGLFPVPEDSASGSGASDSLANVWAIGTGTVSYHVTVSLDHSRVSITGVTDSVRGTSESRIIPGGKYVVAWNEQSVAVVLEFNSTTTDLDTIMRAVAPADDPHRSPIYIDHTGLWSMQGRIHTRVWPVVSLQRYVHRTICAVLGDSLGSAWTTSVTDILDVTARWVFQPCANVANE